MKKHSKIIIIAILSLFIASVLISFYYPVLKSFKLVFGSVFIVFLPGFFLTYLFFPKSKNMFTDDEKDVKSLDWVERIIYSFFLSIALTTLIFLVMQKLNIKISTAVFAIAIISANIGLGILASIFMLKRREKK